MEFCSNFGVTIANCFSLPPSKIGDFCHLPRQVEARQSNCFLNAFSRTEGRGFLSLRQKSEIFATSPVRWRRGCSDATYDSAPSGGGRAVPIRLITLPPSGGGKAKPMRPITPTLSGGGRAVLMRLITLSPSGGGKAKQLLFECIQPNGRTGFSLPPSKIRDFCHLPCQVEAGQNRCASLLRDS